MTEDDLARYIDFTLLHPHATAEPVCESVPSFKAFCDQAVRYPFMAVCVPPRWIKYVKQQFVSHPNAPRICTVIGFPHGTGMTAVKSAEALAALEAGARELDMVLPVGQLIAHDHRRVVEDISGVVRTARAFAEREAIATESAEIVVKVILETGFLPDDDTKRLGCRWAEEAGADFVKTSTGYAMVDPDRRGARLEDIALMHEEVGGRLGIKASGGIGTGDQALAMLEAGATRLGCSRAREIFDSLPA